MLGILSNVFRTAARFEDAYGDEQRRVHEQRKAEELRRRRLDYNQLFYQRHNF